VLSPRPSSGQPAYAPPAAGSTDLPAVANASHRPTDGKLWRNKVYRSCGIVILAAVLLGLFSSALLPKSVYDWANPLLWCEAAAVWAFAAAWFVKGETVLTDAQVSSLRSGRARPWSQAPAGG
jgi:hypothetical protein